ncbi:carbohydrate binding family 9 domain-containing protein [Aestuariibacter sp. AA17]|uniref:Carbohydrate binding family 9 domain-containing protein n=1 Tax=Fluctibacter corallii TaxID=2984329 RepID=A0ABT3ABR6_9ALTE|nr:carbohydrate binding family 9 domain-containing protein [Aestuariibacter sp. AA17]MCV2885721.1 carbohydrate binding family 9 domain-containing protein [Aestuariibacter sp. AA17]
MLIRELFKWALLLTCFFGPSFAYSNAVPPHTLPSLPDRIAIDGYVNEAAWDNALKQTLDYQTWPNENEPAPVKTDVWIYENGEYLYVAFKAYDPDPASIYALYRDRDLVISHDNVGVEIDTFNDNRLAYRFNVNPYGVQTDSIYNELTGTESYSWDATWQSAGRITNEGYEVEIALPLEVFSFEQSQDIKTWGIRLVRFYPREENMRLANVPYSRDQSCLLCQYGRVQGFKHVSQGSDTVVSPFVVAGRQRSRDLSSGNDWHYEGRAEAGVTAKWNPTPEVSLSGTINPDFSQVEADVAQLSVNTPFSLFYEEKRPFFLENNDYFSTYTDIVYTRNLSAPDYGVKATGRMGSHTLGVFVADDESTTFFVPGNISSSIGFIDEESTNAAARYRYDYSSGLSIGAVTTLRESDNYHNYVFGVDAQYDLTQQDTITMQVLKSDTEYPLNFSDRFCKYICGQTELFNEAPLRTEEQEISGAAFKLEYSHFERDWNLTASRESFDEDFRADLGYIPAIDTVKDKLTAAYLWYEENSWWNEVEARGTWEKKESSAGELLEQEWDAKVIVTGIYKTYFELGYSDRERVGFRSVAESLRVEDSSALFDEHEWYMQIVTRPISTMYISQYFRTGRQIDFVNNRLGDDFMSQTRFFINLGIHTTIDVHHTYQDFDVDSGDLFTASLTDARITYQFDKEQFIRLTFAYNDVDRHLENYVGSNFYETNRDFGTQLLYSYKVNPFTKFFLGYSDFGVQNDQVPHRRVAEQSLFMKVSYAWYN